MSGLVTTLKDGSQVSSSLLNTTTVSLQMLAKEDSKVFLDLVANCKYAKSPPLCPETIRVLRGWDLMGADKNVYADIKKIVSNAIEWDGCSSVKFVSPFAKRISKL